MNAEVCCVLFYIIVLNVYVYVVYVVVTTEIFPRTMNVRRVQKTVLSVEQEEGLGAQVRRSIGRKEVRSSAVMLLAENALNSTPQTYAAYFISSWGTWILFWCWMSLEWASQRDFQTILTEDLRRWGCVSVWPKINKFQILKFGNLLLFLPAFGLSVGGKKQSVLYFSFRKLWEFFPFYIT